MNIETGDYILGFWVGSCHGSDFLMTVIRRKEGWIGEYRFRYHVDEKVGLESRDEKSWYGFKAPVETSEEEVLRKCGIMAEYVRTMYPDIEYHEVKGDFDRFRYVAAQCPFMHISYLTKEEYEKHFSQKGGARVPEKD